MQELAEKTGTRASRLGVFISVMMGAALYAASIPVQIDSDTYMLLLRPLSLGFENFCRNDWYVGRADYDWAFTWVIGLICRSLPSKSAVLPCLHVLYCVMHYVLAVICFGIFRKQKHAVIAWLLCLVLLMSLYARPYYTLTFMPGHLSPASFSAVLVLMGLALLLQDKLIAGIVLISLASLFHLNTFILCGVLLVVLAACLVLLRRFDRKVLLGYAIFLAAALPSLYTIFSVLSVPAEIATAARYVVVNIRAPHHYQVQHWPLKYTLLAWSPMALALFAAVYPLLREGRRVVDLARLLLIGTGAVLAIVMILAIGLRMETVVRLNLFRLMPFGCFVGFCILSRDLLRHLEDRRWGYVVALALVGLLVCWWLPGKLILGGGVLVVLAGILVWLAKAPYKPWREAIVVVVIGMRLFAPIDSIRHARGELSSSIGPPGPITSCKRRPVHDWVRKNTPVGSTILIDPSLSAFRYHSERAVVVNFKCCPYLPADCLEWHSRITAVTREGVPGLWRSADYAAKSLSELKIVATKYGASHIVVTNASPKGSDPSYPFVYRDRRFTVYDVDDVTRQTRQPYSAPAGEAVDVAPGEPLSISFRLNLGEDRGQRLGSVFSLTDANGEIIAGAGAVEAYSTHMRDNNRVISFYFKKPGGKTRIVPVEKPFPNKSSARLFFDGNDLLALCSQVRRYDKGQWTAKGGLVRGFAGTQSIGSTTVQYSPRLISADGKAILKDDERQLRPYYFDGKFFVVEWTRDPHRTRLLTFPWRAEGLQPLSRQPCTVIPIPTARQYNCPSIGTYGRDLLLGTYDGEIFKISDGKLTTVLKQSTAPLTQFYSMIHYFDTLLMGTCPYGRIFEYENGRTRPFVPALPVPQGSHSLNREAQTLSVYCGDLYAGVWPWGELWRFDGRKWSPVSRMFSTPPMSAFNPITGTHNVPFAAEYPRRNIRGLDTNRWGQRVPSLTNAWDSLFIATAAYGADQRRREQEKSFIVDEVFRQYGAVHRLTRDFQITCAFTWKPQTVLGFTITGKSMKLTQEGKLLSELTFSAPVEYPFHEATIVSGWGVYGQAGVQVERLK